MPSVRDILKGPRPEPPPDGPRQGLGPATPTSAPQTAPQEQSPAELIAERLRFAADQRAAFAQDEIKRLQQRIEQIQQRMEDLTAQNLPVEELRKELAQTQERLGDAQADLSRAHEARQNTDLAAGLNQLGPARQSLGEHQGHGTGGADSVRDTLGKNLGGETPKVGRSHGVKH